MDIREYTSLDDVPAAIAERLSVAAGQSPVNSMEWVACLIEHSQPDIDRFSLLVVTDAAPGDHNGGRILALAGYRTNEGRFWHSLTGIYSVEYGPLLHPLDAQAADLIGALARHLLSPEAGIDQLEIRFLKDDDPLATALDAALQAAGGFAERFFQYDNWHTRLDGHSYASFLAERPSRLRNTLKRRSRQIADDPDYRVEIVTDPTPDHLAAYAQVYRKSWKGEEAAPGLIDAICRKAADYGGLRLGLLHHQETPVAAQIWLVAHGRALIYKLAYDETFKAASPGTVLSGRLFAHAIDQDRVTLIDYGVGNEAYKQDWMTERARVFGVRIFNRASGRARMAILTSALRLRLKTLLGRV